MLQGLSVVLVVFMAFAMYTLLPNYYARNMTKLVKKQLTVISTKKIIALTFDDGPDKRYTGQVLDVLKEHHVRATFFIVAKNARKCPELITRMCSEGHELAMHGNNHKSAWLSFPCETKKEFEKSFELFNELELGLKFFRPPWGTFNAVSLRYALKNKLQVVLWTVEAFDWRKDNTPTHICEILLKRVQNRDIVVLHDSGGAEKAPQNTIEALKMLLPRLEKDGYHLVTLSEGMK